MQGTAPFQKNIFIPQEWQRSRIKLFFELLEDANAVYVNGKDNQRPRWSADGKMFCRLTLRNCKYCVAAVKMKQQNSMRISF